MVEIHPSPPDHQRVVHVGVVQALQEGSPADHPGGTEDQNTHDGCLSEGPKTQPAGVARADAVTRG